jgi:hypothetical protein
VLGYAIGVIVAHGAVTVAVAVGLPTTLPVSVTGAVAQRLLALYTGILGIGCVAGGLAAYPVATCPPGLVGNRVQPRENRLPDALSLSLLEWRTLVPTAATLATFVVVVSIVVGLATAAGPVLASGDVTVTEPGSVHPVASQVPAPYAEALREQGYDASGEILLFTAVDDQPFTARGADFGAFANVTDAELRRGRRPSRPDEAVIGAGLARTLGVDVGERLTIGGSTRPGLTRLTVVGTFEAPGGSDDQLIVPLATARQLAGVGPDEVQFVRLPERPTVAAGQQAVEVVALGPAGPVIEDQPLEDALTDLVTE